MATINLFTIENTRLTGTTLGLLSVDTDTFYGHLVGVNFSKRFLYIYLLFISIKVWDISK